MTGFEKLGVKLSASDEATLTSCSHPLSTQVLQYRTAAKTVAAIKGLLDHVLGDGKIHAQFHPLGNNTGRFSSRNPNLQQVSRGQVRECFVASAPDRALVVADYPQIELRVAALLAEDAVMLKAFRSGEDLHQATAAAILSKGPQDISTQDRQLAKAVNFGFLYGQGAPGFRRYAKTFYGVDLTDKEATYYRWKFFGRYQQLALWYDEAWAKAGNTDPAIAQGARTVLGRLLMAGGSSDWAKFQLHTNYVVQGSAADLIKVAMVNLSRLLPAECYLVATVHDELLLDVPLTMAEEIRSLSAAVMEAAFNEVFSTKLPIKVEAKVCSNWAEK